MTIARGTKTSAGGGTAFVDGTSILAAEVNTDFDTVYAEVNVLSAAGGAGDPASINDYSDSTAEMRSEVSPGAAGTESAPTALSGELERIRYKLHELGLGISTVRNTTASGDDTYWYDLSMKGPNLVRNGNFAVHSTSGGSTAPEGWELENTPTTVSVATLGVSEGPSSGVGIKIVSNAANEGIKQTIAGLKASTKYLIGCRAQAAAGDTAGLLTTGANGAVFGNLTLTTTSATPVTLAGVIVTDATPTDIVVKLVGVGTSDNVDFTHVFVRECNIDHIPTSDTAWVQGNATADTPNHFLTTGFTDSGATCSITTPGPGYVIEVEAQLTYSGANAGHGLAVQIQENGSGVADTYGTILVGSSVVVANLRWINTAPIPGQPYIYTLVGRAATSAIGLNFGEAAGGVTPVTGFTARTYIRARAYLESGGH